MGIRKRNSCNLTYFYGYEFNPKATRKQQEDFRIKSIQDLTGYDDAQTQKALEALCGTSDEYKGIGTNVPKGWFSGSDTDIRLATDGEFFEKAKKQSFLKCFFKQFAKFFLMVSKQLICLLANPI